MPSNPGGPAPLDVVTQLVFNLLDGAGLIIARAPEQDKQRTRDDCAALIRRMLEGLRHPVR